MIKIDRITITDAAYLWKQISSEIRDIGPEIDPDDEGMWECETFYFITLHAEGLTLDISFKIRSCGEYYLILRRRLDNDDEYKVTRTDSIEELDFYYKGVQVEVSNINEVMKDIDNIIGKTKMWIE